MTFIPYKSDEETGGAGIGPAAAVPAGSYFVDEIANLSGTGETKFDGSAEMDVGALPVAGAKIFYMTRYDKPFEMKRG